MAKRRQTTGMPTKSRQEAAQKNESDGQGLLDNLLGNPKSRQEREEAINQLLIRSITVAAIVVVVLIGAGLIYSYLFVPTQGVAVVNGETITVREFRNRINLERGVVNQQAQARFAQLQQQADAFGVDVNQLIQNDQQLLQWQQELSVPDLLGQRVIDDMVDDILIRQEAESRNITVNEELVDDSINTYFGYDPTQVALIGTDPTETPTPTITPTPFVSPTPSPTPLPTATPTEIPAEATVEVTEEATEDPLAQAPTLAPSPTPSQEEVVERFEQNVETFRQNIREVGRVGNAEVDAFFERLALQNAMIDEIVGTDNMTTFVNVRHILVETEDEAQAILAALEEGASFAALARANSTDTGSGANGGELGWSPAANFVPEFRDASLTAEIGVITGPVESQFGFHILQVRDREEREVTGAQLDQVRAAEFNQWLEDLRESNADNIEIYNNWPDYLN